MSKPSEKLVERVAQAIYGSLCAVQMAGRNYVGPRDEFHKATIIDGLFCMEDLAQAAIAAMKSAPEQKLSGNNRIEHIKDSVLVVEHYSDITCSLCDAKPTQQPVGRSELDIALEVIGSTIARWIIFKEADGCHDESFVVNPPMWPTIGVLKNWVSALERARSAIKRELSIQEQSQLVLETLQLIILNAEFGHTVKAFHNAERPGSALARIADAASRVILEHFELRRRGSEHSEGECK